ncbi:MAG: hypothetical protein PWP34_2436 [Desulfuromonadales bacterium]|jgi:hypothetical protein|nr:hypothetical protein [Desulfuromonadales bacterium]
MSDEWEDFDWPDLDRELTFRQLLCNARPEDLLSVAMDYAEKHNIKGFFPFPQDNESQTAMIDRWVLEAEIAKQKPLADKGQAFTDGCKKKGRMDALGRLIKETHDALLEANHKEPSAEDLWSSLPVGPAGSVIQEIEDGVIYWQNDAGAPKETSFKAFQNRLPKIKNS